MRSLESADDIDMPAFRASRVASRSRLRMYLPRLRRLATLESQGMASRQDCEHRRNQAFPYHVALRAGHCDSCPGRGAIAFPTSLVHDTASTFLCMPAVCPCRQPFSSWPNCIPALDPGHPLLRHDDSCRPPSIFCRKLVTRNARMDFVAYLPNL